MAVGQGPLDQGSLRMDSGEWKIYRERPMETGHFMFRGWPKQETAWSSDFTGRLFTFQNPKPHSSIFVGMHGESPLQTKARSSFQGCPGCSWCPRDHGQSPNNRRCYWLQRMKWMRPKQVLTGYFWFGYLFQRNVHLPSLGWKGNSWVCRRTAGRGGVLLYCGPQQTPTHFGYIGRNEVEGSSL